MIQSFWVCRDGKYSQRVPKITDKQQFGGWFEGDDVKRQQVCRSNRKAADHKAEAKLAPALHHETPWNNRVEDANFRKRPKYRYIMIYLSSIWLEIPKQWQSCHVLPSACLPGVLQCGLINVNNEEALRLARHNFRGGIPPWKNAAGNPHEHLLPDPPYISQCKHPKRATSTIWLTRLPLYVHPGWRIVVQSCPSGLGIRDGIMIWYD